MEEVSQEEINQKMIDIMTLQGKQIRTMAQGLADLNERVKELEDKKPKSFL
jgi:gamma-glutamyl phosphate reductase